MLIETLIQKFESRIASPQYDPTGIELLSSKIRRAVEAHEQQVILERDNPRLKREREERMAADEAVAREQRNKEHENRFWSEAESALRSIGLKDADMHAINAADEAWPAMIALRAWAKTDEHFCVVGGDPGTGKSVAACYVLYEQCREKFVSENFSGWFWRPGWGHYVKASELARLSYYAKADREWLERLGFLKWLVIDDLGSEATSSTWAATFFELIEERSRNKVKTIITSNIEGKVLRPRYDKRVMRRLFDFGTFLSAKRPPPQAANPNREPGSEG